MKKALMAVLLSALLTGIYYLYLAFDLPSTRHDGSIYVPRSEHIEQLTGWKILILAALQAAALWSALRVLELMPLNVRHRRIVVLSLTLVLGGTVWRGYRSYSATFFSRLQTGAIVYRLAESMQDQPSDIERQQGPWRAFVVGTCGYASIDDVHRPNDTTTVVTRRGFKAERVIPLLYLLDDWQHLSTHKEVFVQRSGKWHRQDTTDAGYIITETMRLVPEGDMLITEDYIQTIE